MPLGQRRFTNHSWALASSPNRWTASMRVIPFRKLLLGPDLLFSSIPFNLNPINSNSIPQPVR